MTREFEFSYTLNDSENRLKKDETASACSLFLNNVVNAALVRNYDWFPLKEIHLQY